MAEAPASCMRRAVSGCLVNGLADATSGLRRSRPR